MWELSTSHSMRPSFPKRHGEGLGGVSQPPPPPKHPPPDPPPATLPFKMPPKMPPAMANVPEDLKSQGEYLQRQVETLEALQKSYIETAHRQMHAQPDDVFLLPMEEVLWQLNYLATEVADAKAKKAHLDNYIASLAVANMAQSLAREMPAPAPPPVPSQMPRPSKRQQCTTEVASTASKASSTMVGPTTSRSTESTSSSNSK